MKLALIVPYRDRPEHLKQFLDHYRLHLPDADIFIIEQEEGRPFNRGKLLNVGFLEAQGDCYYCFHDVDMLAQDVDFSYPFTVTQLASSPIQKHGYLGGVTLFNKVDFIRADGYNNEFFCRAEDNEMMFNLIRKKVKVRYRIGNFISLPHERTGLEFDPVLWNRAKQPRVNNGLQHCSYKVLSVKKLKGATKITVRL